MNNFIQFELWKECSQHCPFCFNRGQKAVDKDKSFTYILDTLNHTEPDSYDYFGLIGGEFFNGEMVGYEELFKTTLNRMVELNPKKIFITTSLLFDIGLHLIPFLKDIQFKDKIVLCTSWDVKYRFHNQEQQALWAKNVLWLRNHFPELEVHVEMIITQHLIDAVLAKHIQFDLFKQVFKCSLDFIEPSSGLYFKGKEDCQKALPGFFPTKVSFIKFLNCIKRDIDLQTFLAMDYRSNELHYYEDGLLSVASDRRETAGRCELRDKTRGYEIGFIDSEESMRDVVIAFNELTSE